MQFLLMFKVSNEGREVKHEALSCPRKPQFQSINPSTTFFFSLSTMIESY